MAGGGVAGGGVAGGEGRGQRIRALFTMQCHPVDPSHITSLILNNASKMLILDQSVIRLHQTRISL